MYGSSGTQRAVLILRNTSLAGEIISIAFGQAAKAGAGIVLNPNDQMIFSKDSGYVPSNEFVSAIASVATATLSIHEEIDLI